MLQKKSLIWLNVVALVGLAAWGQEKPNFTGSWELAAIERDGLLFGLANLSRRPKSGCIKKPKLMIKMISWDQTLGTQTLELSYTTDGKAGIVGYRIDADRTKAPVNGSAHWEGNRLVYEQEHVNAQKGTPRRIIRTCTLDASGSKFVTNEVYWMAGGDRRLKAKWTWEKKNGTP
jgi:hypothetical protein